jgi:exonuclease I
MPDVSASLSNEINHRKTATRELIYPNIVDFYVTEWQNNEEH